MAATDSSGGSSSPVKVGFNLNKTSEKWKRHIVLQLRRRDKTQKFMFQDVISSYIKLLDRSNQKAQITQGFQKEALGRADSRQPPSTTSCDSKELMLARHQDIVTELRKTGGELAYQIVELNQKAKLKDSVLEEQRTSLSELKRRLGEVEGEWRSLQSRIQVVEGGNQALKQTYDTLLKQHQELDDKYRQEKVQGSELLEDLIRVKELAAENMNHKNERRVRAKEASLRKELATAAKKAVNIDIGFEKAEPTDSGAQKGAFRGEERLERRQTRPFRSASVTSPKIFNSIKELFDSKIKKRGHSVSSLNDDVHLPMAVCVSARIPAKPLHVLEAHELGINAVKFSPTSKLLATGGTDCIIKLWDVIGGKLHSAGTLEGSNEGITSIEFDPTGTKVLAASYDKSALFWKLDDSAPKFTLTGHSRKVTSAKFKLSLRQAVTGSADRTVKIWDLQRAACVKTLNVFSFCSDVVCSEYFIVSGHFDKKIRFWDSRAASCTQEVPLQGKVTSLEISPDHTQLLSCSRDECLQVIDLRMNNIRKSFRAEGFKCGSDWTKAIFSPDGSYVTAGSSNGAVYVWNVNSGLLETCLPEQHSSSVNAVSWSLSGEYVVSVDRSRRAVLWSDI
ncbi:autophagy-related protein 16-2-like isoform X1 [Acipenser oxyrinchus oxyrinchus]|uniref:Protein Atg16l2 n=1 Tax=Acipenser oxyrinchus oxyrinchus TaxID=40147 RepID=A0AAD8DED3_ACIOX|nr:autophagy-related protein 16-2-like isoform X1 [Acipenser oxyrinchus oxyrinchus]